MRYFVVADDGSRYGPADVATLNSWIQEGRLLPATLLEDESSGARIAAAAVSGLIFPSARSTEAAAPPQGSIYSNPSSASGPGTQNPYSAGYAQSYRAPTDEGNTENIIAWVLGGIGLVLCCCYGFVPAAIGALLAHLAKKKGNFKAQSAFIFNVVVIVVSILTVITLKVAGKQFVDQFGGGKFGTPLQQQQIRQMQRQMGAPPQPPSP
jgi:hypothetical protein